MEVCFLNVYGERLRTLRESGNYSQTKFAGLFGVGQSSVVRYEKGEASPPLDFLVKVADYFDVSLDYIMGRTEHPQGKLYELKARVDYTPEMENFVEMCFDPESPMNARLKQTLIQMLREESKE